MRILTSAWRGVACVQERGGTSCPARAELPAEPEDLLPRGVERFQFAGLGREVQDFPGDRREFCSQPVLGAMVSPSVRAGVTAVERKGLGGQSCEGSRSGSQLRMEQAGEMG